MPQFVLLDHSLKRVGGHHFDYDAQILRAAVEQGWETVVLANRSFRVRREVLSAGRVVQAFRNTMYSPHTLYQANGKFRTRDAPQSKVPGTRTQARDAGVAVSRHWATDDAQKHIAKFHADCRRAFKVLALHEGDLVFVPSLSELDLLGLANFLAETPKSQNVDWHLQFHFEIFEGREPEYAAQNDRETSMRECFEQATTLASDHRLHYYTTSVPLSEQYNRLEVATFTPLAYPINPSFSASKTAKTSQEFPLRVSVAGALRPEKGQGHLDAIASDLRPEQLDTGRLQFWLQTKKKRLSGRPRLTLANFPTRRRPAFSRVSEMPFDPIAYVKQPLAEREYVEFIQRTDIGLLLYDSVRYYARRAGILGEYLASGIPVVVPAGCWLAEQIAETNFQHLDRTMQSMDITSTSDLDFHEIPADAAVTRSIDRPMDGDTLMLSHHRGPSPTQGVYVETVVEQLDASGQRLSLSREITGVREDDKAIRSLVSLNRNARSISIRWKNAYGQDNVPLGDIRVHSFQNNLPRECPFPAGALGRIAADRTQVADQIADISWNYEHYRRHSEAFAETWFEGHDPRVTLHQLKTRSTSPSTASLVPQRLADAG